MKKVIIGTVLLMAASLSSFSQTKSIVVSGRVLEDSNEPAAQATVQLLALPDSSYAAGIATSQNGYFTLPKVKPGKYVLKVSYIGFKSKLLPLQLSASVTEKKVGTLTLETDAVMLKEAVVTAEAPQVQVKEDTLVYNSSAYRTPEGAMLEELVKKLPGAEVDDNGNVTINGKELKKIMVNGKEFFGGDVKTGLKNLPVEMVDKLKAYDKKSDLARITGIDDGEEETVLDLTVKKGMDQGLFGNIDLAGGTEDRYSGRMMLSYYRDKTQMQLLGSGNNVNDQGFSGGGGGPRWRRNNGLTTTRMLGMSFATETDKIEIGGSARYNYNKNYTVSRGYAENFLANGSSFSNSNSISGSKGNSFNADFRMEWRPDSLTNIIFRPNFSWNNSKNNSVSQSGTFKEDPFAYVTNPNDYLDLATIDNIIAQTGLSDAEDPLEAIRLNLSNKTSRGASDGISANGMLQFNRRLGGNGRNLTFVGRFDYSDKDSESWSTSRNRYFSSVAGLPEDIFRYSTTPSTSQTYSAQVTYSEPVARATFLQFSYQFQYQYTESDRRTYDLLAAGVDADKWGIYDPLPAGYENHEEIDQSKYAEYKYFNHEGNVSLQFIRDKYRLSTGFTVMPQHTILSYQKGNYMTDTVRNVVNFSPSVDFRYRFSKQSQLRFTYRGRSAQPGMENLLPIVDNADPLNVSEGNPALKPSFSHHIRAFFNDYKGERQQGMMAFFMFNATQNSISQVRRYDATTGGWHTKPENVNGNWSLRGRFNFNTALRNKKFTVETGTGYSYANNVGYLAEGTETLKNRTTDLNLNERLRGAYRNDWIELGLDGTFSYQWEKDKLRSENNQQPYTFSYGGSLTLNAPWNMSFTTNMSNQSRRGYTDTSMNRNELIWNAQLSQSFFKGAATLTFEMYDILKNQTNISRSLTASGRSVYEYNGVNSYCMLHFAYRLNIFGSKAAREKMQQRQQEHGPGFGPGGPGPGGFGGSRRSGGGGFGGGRPF